MHKLVTRSMLAAAVVLSVLLGSVEAGLELMRDGQPRATIVVAAKHSAVAELAAKEFQVYVQKTSGALLPIVDEATEVAGAKVVIGPSALARRLAPGVADLPANGFVIRTRGDSLVLAGADGRGDPLRVETQVGTLFGVYAFLRDQLGIRWIWPGELGEVIPRRGTIRVGNLERRHVPRMLYCYYGADFTKHSALTLWQRRNGIGAKVNIFFGHAFNWLIKKELYDQCPEMFVMLKGRRVFGSHPCYNSPEFLKRAIPWARKRIMRPNVVAVSLMPNDGGGFCDATCPHCGKYMSPDKKEPDGVFRTDAFVAFWNKVCEGVGDLPEGKYFCTRTYGAYRSPPRKVRPHKRLMIVLHRGTGCYARPVREKDTESIRSWTSNGERPFLMDAHWFGAQRHALPIVLTDHMAKRVAMWNRYNLKGFRGAACNKWSAFGIMYYLGAGLLRDPGLTKEAILGEWYGAFGRAAPAIRRLYAKVEAEFLNPHDGNYQKAFLRTEFLDECDALLNEARTLAQNETIRKRVDYVACAFQYARFTKERQEVIMPALMKAGWFFHHRLIYRSDPRPEAALRMPPINEFRAVIRNVSKRTEAFVRFLQENGADRSGVGPMPPYRTDDAFYLPDPAWYRYADLQLRHVRAVLDRRQVISAPSEWSFRLDPQKVGIKERWFAATSPKTGWQKMTVCIPLKYTVLRGGSDVPWAWYRHTFRVPADLGERKVSILFGGLAMTAHVYVNGKLVLTRPCRNLPYQNLTRFAWRMPFEVDVTPFTRGGQMNSVVVLTTREDSPILLGFWRPAFICVGTDPIPAPEQRPMGRVNPDWRTIGDLN